MWVWRLTEHSAEGVGSKELSFNINPETLKTALCFILAEEKVELFPWWNKGEIRNPGLAAISTQINLVTSQSLMHGSLECFPPDTISHNNNTLSGSDTVIAFFGNKVSKLLQIEICSIPSKSLSRKNA